MARLTICDTCRRMTCSPPVFFRLSSLELWLIVAAVVLGFVAVGYVLGRALRKQAETLREPVGIVQGAFFALVGLILAFGLTLAIGRYDSRRAAVVDDANAIGTTYLRAQTLAEPTRSRSLRLLKQYTDASLTLSHAVPTTARVPARGRRGKRSPTSALAAGRKRAHGGAAR